MHQALIRRLVPGHGVAFGARRVLRGSGRAGRLRRRRNAVRRSSLGYEEAAICRLRIWQRLGQVEQPGWPGLAPAGLPDGRQNVVDSVRGLDGEVLEPLPGLTAIFMRHSQESGRAGKGTSMHDVEDSLDGKKLTLELIQDRQVRSSHTCDGIHIEDKCATVTDSSAHARKTLFQRGEIGDGAQRVRRRRSKRHRLGQPEFGGITLKQNDLLFSPDPSYPLPRHREHGSRTVDREHPEVSPGEVGGELARATAQVKQYGRQPIVLPRREILGDRTAGGLLETAEVLIINSRIITIV